MGLGQLGVAAGAGGGRSYIGQVATGCRAPVTIHAAAATQMMCRSRHRMAASTPKIQIGFPLWYVDSTISPATGTFKEIGVSGTVLTASLEYPSGTFTQLTFNGSATYTDPGTGLITIFSDPVTAPPQGAFFFVRDYRTSTNGVPFNLWAGGVDTTNGEACTFGTSGVTDQTLSGTVTNTFNGMIFTPVAIIGLTSQPSIGIIGDSRAYGTGDTPSGTSGAIGNIERSISGSFGLINCGVPSDGAADFLTFNSCRMAVLRFCSHLICQYGINDVVRLVGSSATVEANLQRVWALWPDPTRVFQATMEPYTTSSDSWATLGNQTVTAEEAARVAVNDWIRTLPAGIKGFFEIANQVENAQDGGKWQVNGAANYFTADGIHETNAAALAIAASNRIPATAFSL